MVIAAFQQNFTTAIFLNHKTVQRLMKELAWFVMSE